MVKTTVYLDAELALSVRHRAATEGRSQAEIIRAALLEYSGKHGRTRISGTGKFRSGTQDTSEKIEDILGEASATGRWRDAK